MVTDFDRLLNAAIDGRLSRREVLRRAAMLGLSLPAVSLLIAACNAAASPSPAATASPPASTPGATSSPTAAASASSAASASAPPTPSASAAAGTPKRGGTLISGWTASPPGLDPHVEGSLLSIRATFLLYDPLIDLDDKGQLVGNLAESWEEDGNDVVFHLRKGVTFHDGSPFTADDVVASIKRILKPDTGSWKSSFVSTVTDVVAVDPLTARFKQDTYNAALLNQLFWVTIIPKALAEGPAEKMKSSANGTGAWMLDTWDAQVEMVLKRNPNYWKSGRPYLDSLVLQFLPDETTAVSALRTGQIQHLNLGDPRNAKVLEGDPKVALPQTVGQGANMSQINLRKKVLADVRVRQALSLAMDRAAILTAAGNGLGVVSGPIAPNQSDYHIPADQLPNYTQDLDKAKALLAAAGVGPGFPLDVITSPEYNTMLVTAELFADQWRQVGADTKVRPFDITGWLSTKNKPPFDWYVADNLEYPGTDPDVLYQLFHSSSSTATQETFSDPALDKLLEAGRVERDKAKRIDIYHEVQIKVAETQPLFFTYAPVFVNALGANVQGYIGRPDNTFRGFDETWLA